MSRYQIRQLWEKVVGSAALEEHDPGLTYRPPLPSDADPQSETRPAPPGPTAPRPDDGHGLPTLLGDPLAAGRTPDDEPSHQSTLKAGLATGSGSGVVIRTGQASGHGPLRPGGEPYQLIEEIGRGGMGIVYRARQVSLSREVALKQLLPEARTPAKHRSFISEALVSGLFDHPNIVTVHDLGVSTTGEVYLSMKLVDGVPWNQLLHPRRPEHRERAAGLGLADHLGLLLAVCNAIAFAHSKGFSHNDLKPENVMVGDFGEVLVMDWGLAVDFRDPALGGADPQDTLVDLPEGPESDPGARPMHRSAITQPCGTPSYMPPELAAGHGHRIGPWTDVYLLGAILHELCTGQPPHKRPGGVLAALESALESVPPVFPDSVPPELAQVCTRAMAREPGDRFGSVLELQGALRLFLKHRESTVIAERAAATLTRCQQRLATLASAEQGGHGEAERLVLYGGFAEAVAAFQQALLLWDGNARARQGQVQARRSFAETALYCGDLGLAEAQLQGLDAADPTTRDLDARIDAARHERERLSEETARALRAELEQREATLRALGVARQNLAQVFLEKADRSLEGHERQWAQLYLGQALTLDERADTRRRLGLSRQRGARLCWTTPSQPGAQALAFSPDGRLLATVSDDDAVRLWDTASGREVRTFSGHEDCIVAVAFAPAGQLLASGADDRTVRLWNVEQAAAPRVLYGHEAPVRAVAWRPLRPGAEGDLWLASADRRAVWLWNALTGEVRYVVSLPGVEVTGIGWLADGSGLISAGSDGQGRLWDVERGQVVALLDGAGEPLVQLAVSPRTPGQVAAVTAGGAVWTWEVPTPLAGGAVALLGGCRLGGPGAATVRAVAYDPTRDRLAMAMTGGALRLRELRGSSPDHAIAGGDEVRSLAFHPRGTGLAVASEGRRFALVPLPGPEPSIPRCSSGHGEGLTALALSPDGRWLASAALEPTVWIWDAASGAPLVALDTRQRAVRALAFDRSGTLLATAGDEGRLGLWELPAGRQRQELVPSGAPLRGCAFTGDSTVLCYDATGRLLHLDLASGQPLWVSQAHDGSSRNLALSADRRTAALSASDRTVRLYDVATGREQRVIEGHPEWVRNLAFSPDGRWIYTTSVDHGVRAVDLTAAPAADVVDSEPDHRLVWRHTRGLRGLAVSADGRRLAVGSGDRTVRVLDTEAGGLLCVLRGHERGVRAVAFAGDGERLFSGGDDRALRSWQIQESRELLTLRAHETSVRNVLFSPDGRTLASSSGDNTIRLWSTVTGAELQTLRGHSRSVYGFAFSLDGRRIISAGFDESVRLWEVARARALAIRPGKNGGVRSLGLNPQGTLLALGCGDWRVRVYQLGGELSGAAEGAAGASTELRERWRLEGHRTVVTAVLFTPDGQTLLSAGRDGTLRRWSMATGQLEQTLQAHDEPIHDAALSPDGRTVASASADGTVGLWSVATGERLGTLRDHQRAVAAVAFDPGGLRLASGGDDLVVRVWDLSTGALVHRLAGHDGSVRKVAFSPDGQRLASGAGDATVRIWDLREGESGQPRAVAPEAAPLPEQPGELIATLEAATGYRLDGLELRAIPQNRLPPVETP